MANANKGRRVPMATQMTMLEQPAVVCSYCGKADGRIQHTAICQRGRLEVHECNLHPACERGYLAMIDNG